LRARNPSSHRYEQSVRSTVVEAADQPTSSRGKKVEAAAAAKPSSRRPRVTHSSSSPSANGRRATRATVEATVAARIESAQHNRGLQSAVPTVESSD